MIRLNHGISGTCLGVMLLIMSACSGDSVTADGTTSEPPTVSVARTATLGVSCSGCHSDNGTALVPLTGRDAETLITQLTLYRDQETGTTVMHRLARGYTDAEIKAIATYLTNGEAN